MYGTFTLRQSLWAEPNGPLPQDNRRLRERLRNLDECFSEEEATNSSREESLSGEIHVLRAQIAKLSKAGPPFWPDSGEG